ncbi:hypothetical protein C5167_022321 [Papaver somniferum]|uniref:Uncharacterized protein n=1 Tax=Papaver somniferum TaxID=3469 RepID=A0A4Y7JLB2_PAPSO|nr:hypothetical protein C5167_022322 [Papaver somniferum]RZC60539.1 hypothetical protein C5167_022321 [Papaver somniferum]
METNGEVKKRPTSSPLRNFKFFQVVVADNYFTGRWIGHPIFELIRHDTSFSSYKVDGLIRLMEGEKLDQSASDPQKLRSRL